MEEDKQELLSQDGDSFDDVYYDDNQDIHRRSRVTLPGNTEFEMNEFNLVSDQISSKDLKAKILEILECQTLTKEQVKLLLKQGAEDNNLFMISEESYGKLVDALGLKIDEDDSDSSNISDLISTVKNNKLGELAKTNQNKDGKSNEAKIEDLMKSRKMIRDKWKSLHRIIICKIINTILK